MTKRYLNLEHLEESQHSVLGNLAATMNAWYVTNAQHTMVAEKYLAQYLCLPPPDFVHLENGNDPSLHSIFYAPSTVTTDTWPVLGQ